MLATFTIYLLLLFTIEEDDEKAKRKLEMKKTAPMYYYNYILYTIPLHTT